MRKQLYLLILWAVFFLAGCGLVREVGLAIKDGAKDAGPLPTVTGVPPLDYMAVGSYILNIALGSWAAYERRKRVK